MAAMFFAALGRSCLLGPPAAPPATAGARRAHAPQLHPEHTTTLPARVARPPSPTHTLDPPAFVPVRPRVRGRRNGRPPRRRAERRAGRHRLGQEEPPQGHRRRVGGWHCRGAHVQLRHEGAARRGGGGPGARWVGGCVGRASNSARSRSRACKRNAASSLVGESARTREAVLTLGRSARAQKYAACSQRCRSRSSSYTRACTHRASRSACSSLRRASRGERFARSQTRTHARARSATCASEAHAVTPH